MLNNFLKEHGYRLYRTSSPVSNIAAHPLRNSPDVSIGGEGDGAPQRPWCSSLAPGLIRRYQVGCGFEVPTGGRNTGEQGPHPEGSHPQLLVFVTGPGNYQVTGEYPFLCQRCVISLREIVPSEISKSVSYRWRVNHHWSIGRTNGKAIVNLQAEKFSFHKTKNHSCNKILNLYSV